MKTNFSVTLRVLSVALATAALADTSSVIGNFAIPANTVVVPPGSCSNVNQALATLKTTGGTVKLLEGEYLCHSPIVINQDNIALVGAGSTKTVIRAEKGRAIPVVIIGSTTNVLGEQEKKDIPYPDRLTKNVVLSGVSINGSYVKSEPGMLECWDPKTDLSMSCGKDMGYFIRNNSLTIRRSHHVRVNDIQANSSYSGGIVLEKLNQDLIIDGFSATKNAFDGFAGYETTGSVFRNFKLFANYYSGISVDCEFDGNIFEDGISSNNGDNGVFTADVNNNIYRRLKVVDNANLGFYIDGMRTPAPESKPIMGTCDGNEIHDSIISGPKFGVQINFPCKGIVIKNTKIRQPKLECLSLFPNGLDISITGSTCSDSMREISLDNKK